MKKERVAIFIDGQNFRRIMYSVCHNSKLDYAKFIQSLVGERQFVKAYYFDAPLLQGEGRDEQKYNGQQKFYTALSYIPGLELVFGNRVEKQFFCPKCREEYSVTREKGVDILIASYMFMGAVNNQYDTAILLSGDADLAPIVETIHKLERRAKRVENVFFSYGHANALGVVCDRVTILTPETMREFWLEFVPGTIVHRPRYHDEFRPRVNNR